MSVPDGKTVVERHGHLAVRGNAVVDEWGRGVVLRGVSLFWSQWQPQFFNRALLHWLHQDWRINVVRIPIAVHHGGYLDHPQREFAKACTVIDAAIELGIYIVVDWHAHHPERDAAVDFFTQVARRYGSRANLIYETWSEPLKEHDWRTVIKPFHIELIRRIRHHAERSLIVAGVQGWSQNVDKAAADPLPFANTAYALHFYAGTHRQALRDKVARALTAGIALMVTEWGTSEASGDGRLDLSESRRWLGFLEENGLSHINWSMTDKAESSAALKPGASPQGGWPDNMITPSGVLVRRWIRERNMPACTRLHCPAADRAR